MSKHSLSEHTPIKIHVRRLDDRDVIVHSVEVKEPSARKIEVVMRGMLRKFNSEDFFIDDSEGDRYFR